ncbi:MAG: FecR domain-containing protein, partial [Desulfocapsaceae bacterium]|nr:FecR domain-containing protein [Desulfocapsaceae bacterium]
MKREYFLKILLFWMVICLPAWAGAEDLGFLHLSQMEGDVQIQSQGSTEWFPATINLPVQKGDRLWVPKDAWAQVETQEGSVLRLDAESALEILAVDEQSLQVYLSQGQTYLNFKKVNDSMLQVDTPVSSIRIYDSSTLNVALAENGNTEISVFRGAVFAENRSGEVRVGAGKMLSMDDDLPSLMALAPPDDWERWNKEWDESLAAGEESEQYLPQELSGYGRDLNRNGRWVETREYGYVWTPTIDISADWAPYRHGRWVWIGGDYVWIASEPWGWAPYHYGRWSYISSHGWCWVPPPRHEVYWGPGYVSWVSTANDVAWVPLAPGETYYGHGHYGPHSVNVVDIDNYTVIPGRNYRNVHVRNAVSVVRRDAFLRGQYRYMGHRENPFLRERIHFGRPMLDPERTTMMPIISDIPKKHHPPQHLWSLPGRTFGGERHMVRERDRSVFRPTSPPRPLLPTIRMNPGPTVKQGREQTPTAPALRRQMLEHSVMPRQFGGKPAVNPETGQPAEVHKGLTKPPAQILPQVVPSPIPARVKPVPTGTEKTAPMFRGQQPMPQQRNMPEQLRGRPTIDPERFRSAKPPVQVQPQVVPAPMPAHLK